MSLEIEREIHFLISTIILGVGITFFYDWLRVLRRVIRHRQFFVSLGDLCYWIVCFYLSFQLLYRENNGTIRWFSIAGATIGMVVYKLTISPFFVKYTVKLLQVILHMLHGIVRFVGRPIYHKARIIGRESRQRKLVVKKKLELVRKKLTKWIKMIKLIITNH